MFRDRPLLGCGFGQYDREKMPYLADRSSELPLEKSTPYVQHNAFLSLMVETGVIGVSFYVLLLLLWVRNAWRLWNDNDTTPIVRNSSILFLTLLGAYLPNSLFQDTNIIDGLNLLLFFMAGVISGLAAAAQRQPENFAGYSQERELPDRELLLQSI
jgi:O-antigen ligase